MENPSIFCSVWTFFFGGGGARGMSKCTLARGGGGNTTRETSGKEQNRRMPSNPEAPSTNTAQPSLANPNQTKPKPKPTQPNPLTCLHTPPLPATSYNENYLLSMMITFPRHVRPKFSSKNKNTHSIIPTTTTTTKFIFFFANARID